MVPVGAFRPGLAAPRLRDPPPPRAHAGHDQRRIRLAYSLQLSMPGTPVIRYGDEIGMGEDLRLPEREAIRTPMQWDDTPGAGFSRAAPEDLVAPVVDGDGCPAAEVDVLAQRIDPDSLLTWFERMLHTLRECSEIGRGEHHEVKTDNDHVLAHVAQDGGGAVLFVHNLADEPCTVSVHLASRPAPSSSRRTTRSRPTSTSTSTP